MITKSGMILVLILFFCTVESMGQGAEPTRSRCVTGTVMEKYFLKFPREKGDFEKVQQGFQQQYEVLRQVKKTNPSFRQLDAVVNIPVVVHVVMDNPSLVTDEQIQSQIDVLNADYSGNNADSVNIPAAFKPFFGKGNIRFCLAQRDPFDDPTNGIVRKVSSTTSVPGDDDPIKNTAMGGANAWDINKYLNIWVCKMTDPNDLGYTFMPGLPGLSPSDIGLVNAYHAFGTIGSARAPFNKGRTATHEIGHFFNLWHIWGSNECVSSCTDSDFVDDTPNQDKCTYGSPTFPKIDACTNATPGVMFMNFMDYVDDATMCLFTAGQVDRMETALSTLPDRMLLMNSDGCVPPVLYSKDVKAIAIVSPANTDVYCQSGLVPRLQIQNLGSKTLTTVKLHVVIDEGPPAETVINLNLPSLGEALISGNAISVSSGYHSIRMFTTSPNGGPDGEPRNDTASTVFSVVGNTNSPLMEGLENNIFPPAGWGIANNSDVLSFNPVRADYASHFGKASVKFDNYNFQLFGKYSILVTPEIAISQKADSVKITFWRASAQYSNQHADSLEILISGDCGQIYTSVYKKGGADLKTRQDLTTSDFVPDATEWVADTVDITNKVKSYDKVMVQFRNINGYGNNLYLDDIHIYARTLPARLKEEGFLIAPNPTTGIVNIQHYPSAVGLKGVAVYSSTGQLVWKESYPNAAAGNNIRIDLSKVASGLYFVRLVYADKIVTKKILKL